MTQLLGTWLLPAEIRALDGPTYARRFAELGAFGIRFVVYADKVETMVDGQIQRDWSEIDYSRDLFRSAGLRPYMNVVGAPPHWCNGAKTYMEGVGSPCIKWNPGAQPPLRYDPTLPECSNPPVPDRAMQMDFYREFVTRYKDDALMFGEGNEKDDPSTSPLGYVKTLTDDWAPSATRAFKEWSLPFAQAARSVKPDVVLAGPEASTYGYSRTNIDLDNQVIDSGGVRSYDLVSTHNYAGWNPFPSGSLSRINVEPGNLLAYYPSDALRGRKHMVGEVGIEHGEEPMFLLAYIGAVWSMGLFEYVTMMIGDLLFQRQGANRTTEPTPVYGAMQKLMQQLTSQH